MMPTFGALAGTPCGRADGVSMAPILTGNAQVTPLDRRHASTYIGSSSTARVGGKWVPVLKQAVRKGKWKAVRARPASDTDATIELYDLTKDIGETKDLAQQHPEIVAEMAKVMKAEHTDL